MINYLFGNLKNNLIWNYIYIYNENVKYSLFNTKILGIKLSIMDKKFWQNITFTMIFA